MEWDAVGAIAESLGAIGVIASLIYLGRQFRHTSTTAVAAIGASNSVMAGGTRENASVLRRGIASQSDLDDDEQFQFSIIMYSLYSQLDFVYTQMKHKVINPDLAHRTLNLLYFYHPKPGVQEWFKGQTIDYDHGQVFSEDFVDFIRREFPTAPK